MAGAGVELLNIVREEGLALHKSICAIVALLVLSTNSVIALEQEPSPFATYHQVTSKIFVYDPSQFSAYTGSDVSRWEVKEPEIVERTRLGIISLTTKTPVYVDVVTYPVNVDYEIRNVKSGELVGKFGYDYVLKGSLLFTGQGVVYEYGPVEGLCWGERTRKFVFAEGKLIEVKQPFQYWSNTNSKFLQDGKILLKPELNSAPVASLTKGTSVKVLSAEIGQKNDMWLLIKTPLGLTGWTQQNLDITNCN